MMVYIAHRGLFAGPDPERENHPEQIVAALAAGWDVEVDVWRLDAAWWLGHDAPTYQVPRQFLNRTGLWLHCKNLDALVRAGSVRAAGKPQYFWHQTDAFTLTSNGLIWTYPGQPLTPHSIWVQPEWDVDWRLHVKGVDCVGICSKHVREISQIRDDWD
jgi:hypothetical protein